MKLSPSEWLFYSLELLSIISIVLVLFGRRILSRTKWRGSQLKSSLLRPPSDTSSTSWEWLTRWTDEWRGYANSYWVLAVCIFALIGFATVPFKHSIGEFPVVEMRNVEVEQEVGDFSYWLTDDQGKRVFATFCNTLGYPPPFGRGETILILKFRNFGDCWDMHDMHPKYVMLRNKDGELIDKQGNLVFKEN